MGPRSAAAAEPQTGAPAPGVAGESVKPTTETADPPDEAEKLPHFISLRTREANLRRGPGMDFRIDWVYRRQGMPLVLLDRFDRWRQVRDPDGVVGWMDRQMLTSKRTVMILGEARPLKDKAEETSRTVALVEPGAIGALERCETRWCLVDFPGIGQQGWLDKAGLWGVDLPADLRAAKPAPNANPGN